MLGTMRKRPDEQLDYDVDFYKWLTPGDVITDASALADPVGVTIQACQLFGTVVKVWIADGLAGDSTRITVTATTGQGRVKEATFNLRISEC